MSMQTSRGLKKWGKDAASHPYSQKGCASERMRCSFALPAQPQLPHILRTEPAFNTTFKALYTLPTDFLHIWLKS